MVEPHPTRPTRAARLRVGVVLITLSVVAGLYFVGSLSWLDRPYPGFKLRVDNAVEHQLPKGASGAQAGLMPGDRVITVDGRPLADPRALYAEVAARPVGTPVTYTFARSLPDGRIQTLTRTIATQRHDVRQWASFFLAFWLTGLTFLALGAAVWLLKPGDPLARATMAFHLVGAIACLSIFDLSTTYYSPFTDPIRLWPWLIGACFLALALQFPRRLPGATWALRLNWGLWALLGALLVAVYPRPGSGFWITFSHLGYIALGELVLLGNAVWAAVSPTSTPDERGQGKVLLLGTLVSTVPALLVPQAHALGVNVNLEGYENFALPLWPAAISYAVVRHRLFDLSPLIRRSLTYVLAAAVLTCLYVGATAGTEALIGRHTSFGGIAGTVLVAFAFVPVRDRIQRWLDARFFRSPYHLDEVLAAFSRAAQQTLEPQALLRAYREAVEGALAPTRLDIHLTGDAPPSDTAERWPLAVQGRPLGHVAVGPKKSGLPFSALDRALLRELTALLATWLDAFERFERARLQTQEIEALKRSEALQGQFLNLVSHELKIPLSVIMSSLNILKRAEAAHDAKTVNHLNRMRRSLTHLVGLVGDLLHAGQLQSGHFHLRTGPVDLDRVVRDTVAELRPLAENKAQALTVEVAPELPPLVGDEARLAQVIRNLIHNAVRYTPDGGRIALTVTQDGAHVRCEVSDDGPGIDEAAMPHLFQRFSQVHEATSDKDQGVGLGLFISHAIVEAHGGAIGVRSRKGQGSTFWFTLPVEQPAVAPAPRQEQLG